MKKVTTDLTGLSIEELNKRAKTTRTVTVALAVILLVEFAVGLYLTIKQGFSIFIVVPIAFLPILVVNFSNIKKIKEEIARRKK